MKDTSRYGWMPTQILRPGVEHLACCNDHLSLDTLEGLYRTNFAKGTHRKAEQYIGEAIGIGERIDSALERPAVCMVVLRRPSEPESIR